MAVGTAVVGSGTGGDGRPGSALSSRHTSLSLFSGFAHSSRSWRSFCALASTFLHASLVSDPLWRQARTSLMITVGSMTVGRLVGSVGDALAPPATSTSRVIERLV
jgi:hypothetical protein